MIRVIDRLADALGHLCAWCACAMVVLTVLVVALRYGFGYGTIALQETVMYLHALVFMLGLSYALKGGAHVRVDVLHAGFSPRLQARIDLLGHLLFLMPVSILIVYTSWRYVGSSWRILEGSQEVGGLPLVFALKTLIPASAGLLMLQGMAETARCWQRAWGSREPREQPAANRDR